MRQPEPRWQEGSEVMYCGRRKLIVDYFWNKRIKGYMYRLRGINYPIAERNLTEPK